MCFYEVVGVEGKEGGGVEMWEWDSGSIECAHHYALTVL